MGNPLRQTHLLTVAEWLEIEDHSEMRHEYFEGEIFDMAGTTVKHNEITFNLTAELKKQARPKGCLVVSENVKLQVIEGAYYTYPDVILSCDPGDLGADYMLKNPTVLIEVLSKSTETTDRAFKWERYQRLPSLMHYLLVSQDRYSVDMFTRANDPFWTYSHYSDLSQAIELTHVGHTLRMADIYANIEIDPEAEANADGNAPEDPVK